MLEQGDFQQDMLVGDVLEKWPQTMAVFKKYETACLGCAFAPFCTLAYVAASHQLDVAQFIAELKAAIA